MDHYPPPVQWSDLRTADTALSDTEPANSTRASELSPWSSDRVDEAQPVYATDDREFSPPERGSYVGDTFAAQKQLTELLLVRVSPRTPRAAGLATAGTLRLLWVGLGVLTRTLCDFGLAELTHKNPDQGQPLTATTTDRAASAGVRFRFGLVERDDIASVSHPNPGDSSDTEDIQAPATELSGDLPEELGIESSAQASLTSGRGKSTIGLHQKLSDPFS